MILSFNNYHQCVCHLFWCLLHPNLLSFATPESVSTSRHVLPLHSEPWLCQPPMILGRISLSTPSAAAAATLALTAQHEMWASCKVRRWCTNTGRSRPVRLPEQLCQSQELGAIRGDGTHYLIILITVFTSPCFGLFLRNSASTESFSVKSLKDSCNNPILAWHTVPVFFFFSTYQPDSFRKLNYKKRRTFTPWKL